MATQKLIRKQKVRNTTTKNVEINNKKEANIIKPSLQASKFQRIRTENSHSRKESRADKQENPTSADSDITSKIIK